MIAWTWAFYIATLYLLYTYVGYPLVLAVWKALRPPPEPVFDPDYQPLVSVILTVRNEEDHVGPKLDDLLAQDYPADRMEIWVASDQSTDRTNEIVRWYSTQYPSVRLVEYAENIGKAVAINRTEPLVKGTIILSCDVRQRIDPDAVSRVVRHFCDPRVGLVGAALTLVDDHGSGATECTGLYWRYERALRTLESRLGMLTGVSGAFLAIRRSLFRPIPPGSYCEDVTLALYTRQAGSLVRWEPEAGVYERMRDPSIEFRRKVRTLVGNYQLLSQFWPLYLPWRGKLAFTLISHKLCRLFIPMALLLLLCASVALGAKHPVFLAAAAAQAALYSAGVLGIARAEWRRNRLVNACGAFCLLNWAALVAMFHVLRHGPRIAWR